MRIYLVGGAIRDKLLGLPVKDRDWVVTGATPEEMTARGFRQVGRDFPVFLHPRTHEEYALARTERKVAPGYKGFQVCSTPEVTLEEDLQRRDLTINAMAQTEEGALVDPYGGAADLRHRLLRHVSPAFAEDPVRILRVARLAARLAPQGFTVAPETMELMRRMVVAGEVDALVPERVWAEFEGALAEPQPARFLAVLRDCHALARLLPEIDRLHGVPQPPRHHPEIDTGLHCMMALETAASLTADTQVRFAALVHDLGKGATPQEKWPRHIGHEQRGAALIEALCARLRIPNAYRDLAVLAALYHGRCHRAAALRPATLLRTLEALDAFRRPARLEQFLVACTADFRGRGDGSERPYPQAEIFRRACRAAAAVNGAALRAAGLDGAALAAELRRRRITAIAAARTG